MALQIRIGRKYINCQTNVELIVFPYNAVNIRAVNDALCIKHAITLKYEPKVLFLDLGNIRLNLVRLVKYNG